MSIPNPALLAGEGSAFRVTTKQKPTGQFVLAVGFKKPRLSLRR
jgi:hypothetical protein